MYIITPLLKRPNLNSLICTRILGCCSIEGIAAETYTRARKDIIVHRDGLLRAPLGAIGACVYVDDMSNGEIERAFARLTAFMDCNLQACRSVSKSFNPLASASPGKLNPSSPSHEAQ